MGVWRRLLFLLGFQDPPGEAGPPECLPLPFEGSLSQSLQALAEQEQRSEMEIAADLLASGLALRTAAQELARRLETLTAREQEVLALVCLGHPHRQISARLGISTQTVKVHVRRILHVFGVHSMEELRLLLNGWQWEQAELPEDITEEGW